MPVDSNHTVKLVKSIFLDIVDYSKRNVETQVVVVLERDRIARAAVESLAIPEDEILFSPIGDGLYIALLTADTHYDIHLRLSLEILRRLSEHNEQSDEGERFQLRTGIDECTDNLITDINGRRNVAGVGANMGSRIMALADGSQILVSQFVHNQLYMRQQYEGKFRVLPIVEVKHGVRLQVSQYIEGTAIGLNSELPIKWREGESGRGEIDSTAMNRPPAVSQVSAELAEDQISERPLISGDTQTQRQLSAGEQQIAETLAALAQATQSPDYATGPKFLGEISDFHFLRLELLASSWLESQVPSAMMGTHESNRLYLHRETLKVARPELFSILRMLINDASGYVPGWFWLRELEANAVEGVILHLAFVDPLAFVRQQAFEKLYSGSVPVPQGMEQRLALTMTADSAPEVRRAALRYLGQVGTASHLPIVGSALVDSDSGVSYQAKRSKYLILARTAADRAFKELLGESGMQPDEILKELEPRRNEIDSTTLVMGIENSNSEIRSFALRGLTQTRQLTVEQAIPLKTDKSDEVKAEAFRFLIEQGVDLKPEEIAFGVPDDRLARWMSRTLIRRNAVSFDRQAIVLKFYRRFEVPALIEMTSWLEWAGHDAYRALAVEHFGQFGETVREDLRTNFAAAAAPYHERELAEWRRREAERSSRTESPSISPSLSGFAGLISTLPDRTPEEYASSSVESRKLEYITAALSGLAANGEEGDIELGRSFLFHSETDVRIEAVKIIHKFGAADDVPDLVKVATSSDALLQELAAKAALKLSDDLTEVAAEFLETADEILVSITLAELIQNGEESSSAELLKPYLNDPRDALRTRAMTFFVVKLERQELESLLAEYLSRETYYYDVVGCFDKVLYSPVRFSDSFLSELKKNLFGFLEET